MVITSRTAKIAKYVLLSFITIVSVLPFLLMLVMTSHSTEEIYTGVGLIPGDDLFINLGHVLSARFFLAFFNSSVVSVTATVVCVIVSSMAAYTLVAYHFRGRSIIYNLILITMMIPGSIGLIGFMVEMRVLGLSKTLIPLMLGWFSSGFGAFWMTQYLKSAFEINLVESARIDGCNEMHIFFRIVIPCVKPAIVTLGLMIFLWSWNSYLTPLILVNSADKMTIPLFIQGLGNEYRTDYAAQITGLALGITPILTMFAFGSKSLIQGLTAGAIKG